MNNIIKAHIVAYILAQFTISEMREVIADISLNEVMVEMHDVRFQKVGKHQDMLLIDFGVLNCEIKESDFLKLIAEIEKEEEINNHLPAQER